jgi:CRISPR-associated endonuclease/helicase Cas3
LDERLIQRWLDEIYTGPILEKWLSKYDKVANEFRLAFINNLRPFGTDESLADAFDRLFDGVEVLPACLEQEYKEFYRLNALEASQLLVPISWAQWHRIKTNGLVGNDSSVWPPVVSVPYSTESGLD